MVEDVGVAVSIILTGAHPVRLQEVPIPEGGWRTPPPPPCSLRLRSVSWPKHRPADLQMPQRLRCCGCLPTHTADDMASGHRLQDKRARHCQDRSASWPSTDLPRTCRGPGRTPPWRRCTSTRGPRAPRPPGPRITGGAPAWRRAAQAGLRHPPAPPRRSRTPMAPASQARSGLKLGRPPRPRSSGEAARRPTPCSRISTSPVTRSPPSVPAILASLQESTRSGSQMRTEGSPPPAPSSPCTRWARCGRRTLTATWTIAPSSE